VIEAVRGVRPMVGAILEQAASVRLEGERLSICFPRHMGALKRQLERADTLEVVRTEATGLAGQPVSVEVRVETDEPAAAQAAGTRTTDETPEATRPDETEAAPKSLLEQARAEPGVRNLLDTFGAQVVEIRPSTRKENRPSPGRRPLEDSP